MNPPDQTGKTWHDTREDLKPHIIEIMKEIYIDAVKMKELRKKCEKILNVEKTTDVRFLIKDSCTWIEPLNTITYVQTTE